MTVDELPTAAGREADLDLYTIGADIPDGEAVLLVTEIDNPDGVFAGRWTTEEEVAKIWDGELYIRLRHTDAGAVEAELILAHDAQLMPIVRVSGSGDWAEQLRGPAAAIMTLHTDLESGDPCKARAAGADPAR
jgi:hypothetical protein